MARRSGRRSQKGERVPAVTKSDLIDEVAKVAELTKKETESVVNLIFDRIAGGLANGDKVELRGFGSFRVRGRKPRRARNPKTGSGLNVPEKRVPFFKVGRHLREFLKQGRDAAASVSPGSVPTPPRAIEEIFL